MALSDLTISLLLAVLPICAIFFGLYSTFRQWHESNNRDIPYPPGPPAGSFLGSASILPKSKPWLTYAEWGRTYGDIVDLNIYGQHTIVLNAVEDAVELLEHRAALYSDRPEDPLIKLTGWDFSIELMPYGEQWRAHRKLFQHCFRSKASAAYRAIQSAKINDLLYSLLTRPAEFRAHCKQTASAIMMATLYDNDLKPERTAYFTGLVDQGIEKAGINPNTVVTLLKTFPILRHLPTWFPGASFKRSATEVKRFADQMRDAPIDYVGKGLIKGTLGPSLVSDLLENCYVQKEFDMVKRLATSSCVGGIDTVASSLGSFFLSMALFPAVQKKVQQELDRVTGADRLPTFDDRPALPYLEAVYRELMRWAPVFPLNTPHVSVEDDIYKGFFIPKGSSIVANIWSMTRNEERYPEPEVFNPDRFLNAQGELNDDEKVLTFGFGRRICPGRYMASSTIWLAMASVLATFDIGKKTDENGKEIPIDVDYGDVINSRPGTFECSISPRRGNSGKLIREATHTTTS